jgi:hypothetical protein
MQGNFRNIPQADGPKSLPELEAPVDLVKIFSWARSNNEYTDFLCAQQNLQKSDGTDLSHWNAGMKML